MSTGRLIARAWEQALTLGSYGHRPGTVGWYEGHAYVKLWDWRTGATSWRPFPQCTRPPQKPKAPWGFGSDLVTFLK